MNNKTRNNNARNKLCQNNSIYNHIKVNVSLDPSNPIHTMSDEAERIKYCEVLWNYLKNAKLELHFRKAKRSNYTLSIYTDDTYIYQILVIRYQDSNYTTLTLAPLNSDNLNDFMATALIVVDAIEHKHDILHDNYDNRA